MSNTLFVHFIRIIASMGTVLLIFLSVSSQAASNLEISEQPLSPLANTLNSNTENINITVLELGNLGGCCGQSNGINDPGNVVGSAATIDDISHPFFWSVEGGMIDIGTLGGEFGHAFAINNQNQVVGQSRNAEGWDRAFIWTADTGIVDLGSISGENSSARDINNLGHIVGSSNTPVFEQHAFFFSPEDGMVDLGVLGGQDFRISTGIGISDQDHVVGASTTNSGAIHAFLWTSDGGIQDLGTLGGNWSVATDVNSQGQVVGRSHTQSGEERAFLWTQSQGMMDLGTLPSGTDSNAEGISEQGDVVGWSTPNRRAFLWTQDSGMQELPPLGSGGATANDISATQSIVGSSPGINRPDQAVLWIVGSSVEMIGLDVKPGSSENSINPVNRGAIPVATLSTTEFNAPMEIDRASLTFGKTGDEPSLHLRPRTGTPNCEAEDVNEDGYDDLVCHFETQITAFTVDDTKGILRGKTIENKPIEGQDIIKIVGNPVNN